ncbi:MAG: hypothetical protein Fur0023_09720 [Bacteroidia bacterium]
MQPLDKVIIIGAGPIGLLTSYFLSKSGSDVYLFDTDKIKVNLIKNEGISIQGLNNDTIKLKNVFSDIGEIKEKNIHFDLAIFCTKSYHTYSAAQNLKDIVGTIPVLSAQNGIETENILKKVFGESNVLRMVINFAGNIIAPNVVKQTFFIPPNYVASVDDSKKELSQQLAEQLSSVDVYTESVNSFKLLRQVWEKTILNSALSALCGISKMTMREVMDQPDMADIVEQTIQEAVEVAEAEKIYFDDDFIRKCIRYLKKAGDHFPSLAIDMINGRETEIDYFNGKIVQYGKKHYIKTPLNLLFYNIVKAYTVKTLISAPVADIQNKLNTKNVSVSKNTPCFLGVDLGSSYTKIIVINDKAEVVFKNTLKTFNKDKISIHHIINTIQQEYNIQSSCATGYGRKHFAYSDITKTEINCAAKAANHLLSGEKTIIDIGGEDIKVIKCDANGNVENFYLNDKCAAGTGSFIAEISERVGLNIKEMNELAKHSEYNKPLNSFCTVFAKTEIMNWIFEGMPVQDVAKGIYLSIASRVSKLRIDTSIPVILIGGLAAYHPFLKEILEKTLNTKIHIMENPQHVVAFGAALMAKEHSLQNKTITI